MRPRSASRPAATASGSTPWCATASRAAAAPGSSTTTSPAAPGAARRPAAAPAMCASGGSRRRPAARRRRAARVRIALSGVGRLSGRFGVERIAQVLTGEPGARGAGPRARARAHLWKARRRFHRAGQGPAQRPRRCRAGGAPGHRGRPARRLRACAHARGAPGGRRREPTRAGASGAACGAQAGSAHLGGACDDAWAPRRGARRGCACPDPRIERHTRHGRRRPRAAGPPQTVAVRRGPPPGRPHTWCPTTAPSWRSPRPSHATAGPCAGCAGSDRPSWQPTVKRCCGCSG